MTPGTKRKRRRQSAQETNARRVLLSSDVVTSLQTIGGMTGHTEIKDTIGMLCRRYAHDAIIKVFFSFACLLPAIPIIHGKCILQFIIPRPAGVFDRTRQAGWGGSWFSPPPPPSSRKYGRSETDQAAIKSSRWMLLKQFLNIFLKGHMSGECQVRGQNRHFSPYQLLWRD